MTQKTEISEQDRKALLRGLRPKESKVVLNTEGEALFLGRNFLGRENQEGINTLDFGVRIPGSEILKVITVREGILHPTSKDSYSITGAYDVTPIRPIGSVNLQFRYNAIDGWLFAAGI